MLSASSLLPLAQQFGHQTPEFHPSMPIKHCTKALGCKSEQTKATIDSNWRWTHKVGEAKDCYHGNSWDPTLCPDAATCAKNCALEGADEEYENTYGIRASGAELKLGFVTQARRSSSARNSSAQFSGARATRSHARFRRRARRVPTRRTSARARTCSTTTRRTSSSS